MFEGYKMNHVIKKINEAIINTEFTNKTYLVGGFCRDMVMGISSKDIDIVVELIDGGIKLAKFLQDKLNLPHAPVIFERFGTAQLMIEDHEVEFVMTRKESYNGEDRNPDVVFGTIYDDVKRRDFSVNSLLLNISTGEMIDLAGGINDIKAGIIRTISNPDIIFNDDPLRIMRAIRFATRFGFKIEDETFNAIKRFIPSLSKISKERIRDEFVKILESDNVVIGIEMLLDSGILTWMIPEFGNIEKIQQQGVHHTKNLRDHILEVVFNSKPTWRHRLAALLHDIGKPKTFSIDNGEIHFYGHQKVSSSITKGFMKNFKFTNDDINLIEVAVFLHMNFVDGMLPKTIRRKINEIGKDTFLFCCDLAKADSKRKERRDIVNDIREFIETDKPEEKIILPINGDDIMNRYNLKPSKLIGELKNAVKEIVFENPQLTKDEAFEITDNLYQLKK